MHNFEMPPGFAFAVRKVGTEHKPVIVVDNALAGRDDLVTYACTRNEFQAESVSSYPGIKAPLPASVAEVVLPTITPLLYRQYNIPAFPRLNCIGRRQPRNRPLAGKPVCGIQMCT